MEVLRQILIPVGAVATLASLPAAIELLLVTSGAAFRRGLPANASPTLTQKFFLAVIVPAHNEEAMIARCVSSLLVSAGNGQPGPDNPLKCSVIVVADNCTDATAARAAEAGASVLVRQNADQRGKGYALRYAFDTFMGEDFDGFLIVDADSIVSPNLVPEIVRCLVAGADAVQTRYRVTQPLDSERKRLMDVALLAFNVLRPMGRHNWGLSAGILGNGFALSRKTLLEVPYSADSIVEDLEYHLLLVNARKKVDFIDSATVYGDMPNDSGAQVSQRARWEGGRARMAAAWVPRLAARFLRGKFFVFEPLLELLTLPLAYLAVAALLLCVLPFRGFEVYGALLILLLMTHVAVAVTLGGNTKQSVAALATAPGYIFWKLTRLGAIIKSSRPETQWLRTPRDPKPEVPDVR